MPGARLQPEHLRSDVGRNVVELQDEALPHAHIALRYALRLGLDLFHRNVLVSVCLRVRLRELLQGPPERHVVIWPERRTGVAGDALELADAGEREVLALPPADARRH